MAKAYEGKEPYIFISYAHKDADIVNRVIDALQAHGFRVWFDAGIEAGSEWPEYIASHLRHCYYMVGFISRNYADSQNCKQELTFAQNLKKPILNVYIDNAELSDGLLMQLGMYQSLYRSNFSNEQDFLTAICSAHLLAPCLQAPEAAKDPEHTKPVQDIPDSDPLPDPDAIFNIFNRPTPPAKEPEAIPAEEPKPAKKASPEKQPQSGEKPKAEKKPEKKPEKQPEKKDTRPDIPRGKSIVLTVICVLIELSYAALFPWTLNLLYDHYDKAGPIIFLSILPHLLITLLWTGFLRLSSKGNNAESRFDIVFTMMFWIVFSIIAAIISGVFFIPVHPLLAILISIGLNILPTVAAAIVLIVHVVIDSIKL